MTVKYGKPPIDLTDHERRDLKWRRDRLQAAYETLESNPKPSHNRLMAVLGAQSDVLESLTRIVLANS